MTNNGQPPGGDTTTAGAVEQLADRIADKMYPRTHPGWIGGQACALAAIIETTEAAAKEIERQIPKPAGGSFSHTNSMRVVLTDAVRSLRNNDHLKGPKAMTTTPATQAILPVTAEVSDYVIGGPHHYVDTDSCEEHWTAEIQIVGGHYSVAEIYATDPAHAVELAEKAIAAWNTRSQAHSLPGDVGMREALSELWSIVHGCDLRLSVPMETIHKVRAALAHPAQATPSALSGDAGEVQDWQKPYADAGHDIASVFNPMTTECKRCGTPQIDLSEDLAYGPMRQCRALPSHQGAGE